MFEHGPENKEAYEREVLEIGCGATVTPMIFKRSRERYGNAHIVRTDINKEHIQQARADTVVEGEGYEDFKSKIEYVVSNGTELSFPDNSFIEVTISDVLGDPSSYFSRETMLKEATRVLKENGELIIVETKTPGHALGMKMSVEGAEREKYLKEFATHIEKTTGLELVTIENPNVDEADADHIDEYMERFPYYKQLLGNPSSIYHPFHFIAVFKKVSP